LPPDSHPARLPLLNRLKRSLRAAFIPSRDRIVCLPRGDSSYDHRSGPGQTEESSLRAEYFRSSLNSRQWWMRSVRPFRATTRIVAAISFPLKQPAQRLTPASSAGGERCRPGDSSFKAQMSSTSERTVQRPCLRRQTGAPNDVVNPTNLAATGAVCRKTTPDHICVAGQSYLCAIRETT
jgi:hypothetical protein